jgi:hypothetical protein
MALAKERVTDKIEVLEDGTIQVRFADYIVEDGKRITEAKYHRVVYMPTDDIPAQAEPRLKAIANLIRTPQVVADFRAKLEANTPVVR